MKTTLLVVWVTLIAAATAHAAVRVPLKVEAPAGVQAQRWPVTVGVPFGAGVVADVATLSVVDEKGQPVPAQITLANQWRDGSVRWAQASFIADLGSRTYAVVANAPGGAQPKQDDSIQLARQADGIVVRSGGAVYRFVNGAGCFESIRFNDRELVDGAKDAWFAVDNTGRRATLKNAKLSVELEGPRHSVIRVEGEYSTPDGQRVAAGTVYYHFYAGLPWARVSHKFIVTEDSNKLWFKDIGLALPLELGDAVNASFANAPIGSAPVRAGEAALMVQETYPHFANEASRFTIRHLANGKTETRADGAVAGNWADASTKELGLAVQVPEFAETFPKALRVSPEQLVVKLWAGEETGTELDFRTESLMKNYFGNDWIPADHAVATASNNAAGTARTHDIWLYPHDASRSIADFSKGFAATSQEIYASIDPVYLTSTDVMGPIRPVDRERFPEVEEVITDLYQRGVQAGQKIFPSTGYLHWGMYPYSQQPWEIRNGRWYPTIHRLSRSLEYNLKRHVWTLYGRSGDRAYFDYARRYTRFMHDIGFSNWDVNDKKPTKGRLYQGTFDSPIVWGGAYLAYASSEDVIQFVYDYFLRGDYHSRDMVLAWKQAMIQDLNWDVDAALKKFYPTVVFLRILGSAYELDDDPKLYDYGHAILERTVDVNHETGLNNQAKQNFSKAGDTFSVFYYYWVSTGDDLALVPLLKLAEFDYRWGRFDFGGRSSAIAYAYALKYRESKDPVYLAYLANHLREVPEQTVTIKEMGVDFEKLNQKTTTEWGQLTLTGSGPVFSGLPVAMRPVAEAGDAAPARSLPIARKLLPTARTYLLFKKPDAQQAVSFDLYVNNHGHRDGQFQPALYDSEGKLAPLQVVEKREHREIKPPRGTDELWQYSPWYYTFETHLSYRLQVPADAPAGVYCLDVGDHVAFTVLHSNVDAFLQVAPGGTIVERDTDYYLSLPTSASTVELFAHRPVHVYRPDGAEVTLSPTDRPGYYTFDTGGAGGAWRLRGGTDKLVDPPGSSYDTFVRLGNVPLIIARGEKSRLFDVDMARLVSRPMWTPPNRDAVTADLTFVPGRFGQGFRSFNGFAEINVGAGSVPREQGTVEFWYRPSWSGTDLPLPAPDKSTHRGQYFVMEPVRVEVVIDPDHAGRVGRYNIVRLDGNFAGLLGYPVRHYFRAGEWYHVALTWTFDGKASDVNLFINGRQRSLNHYEPIPADATNEKLAASDGVVSFGSAHYYNRAPAGAGETFDELRVSRTVRYTEDFAPPAQPFQPDPDTVLLLPCDGDLSATVNGAPAAAQWKKASRMK